MQSGRNYPEIKVAISALKKRFTDGETRPFAFIARKKIKEDDYVHAKMKSILLFNIRERIVHVSF